MFRFVHFAHKLDEAVSALLAKGMPYLEVLNNGIGMVVAEFHAGNEDAAAVALKVFEAWREGKLSAAAGPAALPGGFDGHRLRKLLDFIEKWGPLIDTILPSPSSSPQEAAKGRDAGEDGQRV